MRHLTSTLLALTTDPTDVASQAMQVAHAFTTLGLTEAVTENGSYYSRNPSTGETVVSVQGLLVRERATTVETVIAKPGSTTNELLAATAGFTQKQRGAFVGLRQPAVAKRLAK